LKDIRKIVLIIPPAPFLLDQKRNCPLGILYVASVLEKNNYDVEIADLRDVEEGAWPEKIPTSCIYGITATTPEYNLALKVARLIKSTSDACIILGGAHATTLPEAVDPVFDKVVVGEGEAAILEVLADLEKNVKKKFYRCQRIDDLDSIPFPARHILPFNSVFNDKLVEPGVFATTIITSRGCSFNCAFCSCPTIWGRAVRFRSSNNIIDELRQVIDVYGVKEFRFHDDTLGVNRERVDDLCKKLEPLGIRWRANSRVDIMDYEMIKAMKRGGCVEIDFGIESISQQVMDVNNKGVTLDHIYKALEYVKKAGMSVRLFFIIGLPGEEENFADRIIEFCRKTGPDAIDIATFVPFPGSDIYRNPSKYGIKIISTNFDNYIFTMGLGEGETERGFVWENAALKSDVLKAERKKIFDFVQKNKLVLNR